MSKILYQNISDNKLEEVVILGHLGKDKSRLEIIRKSQINNRDLNKIAGFWVNESELTRMNL